ncbi:MAG: M6 family metalloprotease domain-containing protein [Gemmataceae bacterium]
MRFLTRAPLLALALASLAQGAAPLPRPLPLPTGYEEYRTAQTALRSRITPLADETTRPQPAYLGISVIAQESKLVVSEVASDSPAIRAGVRPGDRLASVDGKSFLDAEGLGEHVRSKSPGSALTLVVEREGKPLTLSVSLGATSRPLTPGARPVVGLQGEEVPTGYRITAILPGMPAARANLQVGDIILSIDGRKVVGRPMTEHLAGKREGDSVVLAVQRGERTLEQRLSIAVDRSGTGRRGTGGWDDRALRLFTRPVYRLAVIPVEFPDVAHNDKISTSDWEMSLFSTGVYNDRSVTGQKVHGSMNDYYREQSLGQFSVEGKCFPWVKVNRKRAEYANESNRSALLTEALDKLLARDGKEALAGYDGIYFLYAGERYQTRRGGLFWPHRASFNHQGKRWSYFICPEGGKTIASISVITHEFGHMLGLPDLYARPEVPGEEGLGVWCTMSTGHGRDGKPLHFSAWCKMQLGWLKPVEIDPRVKQKLVLAPVNGSTTECFKIPVRADGSEYLLLENRRRIGFDRDLPAEGLLIWRVVNGRPVLEESHGIAGPGGPQTFLGSIPYPSGSNTAFTPHTTPSSRALKGGGYPVHVTNITRLSDGRIAFQIGTEFQ